MDKKPDILAQKRWLEHRHKQDQECIRRAIEEITRLETENRALKARLGIEIREVEYSIIGGRR